jgi:drug/metabolite transporter (DMT)-like permease
VKQPGSRKVTGVILISISAACFGTLAIFGHYAYADGMDTFTTLFLRFGFAALLMGALLAWRREPLPRGKTLLQLIGMGALGYVGQSFAYLTATKYASPGLVALLLYLYPTFVAILSAIFLKEHISRLKILALLLALTGTALTVDPRGGELPGVLMAISAATIYSVYILVGTNVMRQVTVVQSSTVIFTAAGAVFGMLTFSSGPHFPASSFGWAAVAAIVLIATVIPVVTFLAGLERIGPTNAAMLSTLEPVVTVLMAALLLGETLRLVTLIGGLLILTSVFLLTRGEFQPPASAHSPEPDLALQSTPVPPQESENP